MRRPFWHRYRLFKPAANDDPGASERVVDAVTGDSVRVRARGEPPYPVDGETEKREEGPYTDAIVRLILQQRLSEPAGDAGDTGALEAAAGVISRAFASATPMIGDAPAPMFMPPMLAAEVARDVVVRGESLLLQVSGVLVRASHWEIRGATADSDRWIYRAQVAAPDGMAVVSRRGNDVAHPRYSSDAERPWFGIAPMERATSAGALAGAAEKRIGEEAAASVGHLLPIPRGGDDEDVDGLKSDLTQLKGRTAVVETTAAGWGEGRVAAPQSDYKPQRIGANWPSTAPQIYSASQQSVLAALGVPVELLTTADGTGQREAWRRCLHGTIEPLGRIIAAEVSKLAAGPVTFDFDRLAASDIAGRARAFQSMVGEGMMTVEEAAKKAGLLDEE